MNQIWGCGPFDNKVALDEAASLRIASRMREVLRYARVGLLERPGDPQLLGYAAAELVGAAGASRPYWQSDVRQKPKFIEGYPGTGCSFYLPPVLDFWVRRHKPSIPPEVILDARAVVENLLQHCDLWPDENRREWYLRATLAHLGALEECITLPLFLASDPDNVI